MRSSCYLHVSFPVWLTGRCMQGMLSDFGLPRTTLSQREVPRCSVRGLACAEFTNSMQSWGSSVRDFEQPWSTMLSWHAIRSKSAKKTATSEDHLNSSRAFWRSAVMLLASTPKACLTATMNPSKLRKVLGCASKESPHEDRDPFVQLLSVH